VKPFNENKIVSALLLFFVAQPDMYRSPMQLAVSPIEAALIPL